MVNDRSEDIFDKIMKLPGFRVFAIPYRKYKSGFLYLFFGGVSLVLNIALFVILDSMRVDALTSNAICWIVCVFFQFFTNRTWVFDGHVDTGVGFIKQMSSFIGSRIFTLIIEEVILAVFVKWLLYNATVVKILAQIITIVLNYILSKLIVFRKNAT